MSYHAQIATARERFEGEIAEHTLTVLRDDGLYRHLRCRRPDTSVYGFDVLTWPGYLAIVGDTGHFVFSRVSDMFSFFESDAGRINPDYWSQKLQAPRPDGAERYSEDAARAAVLEWVRDLTDQLEDADLEYDEQGPRGGKAALRLYQAVRERILSYELYAEHEARRLIADFEHDGFYMDDAWEWSMREYDWQFLWCCHGIVWAIGQYRAAKPEAVAA